MVMIIFQKRRQEETYQLNKYILLQKRQMTKESFLQTQLLSIPNKVEELKEIISNLKQDIRLYVRSKRDYDEKERQNLRKKIWSGMTNNLRSEKEIDFGYYQGFRVVAPAHLLEDNLSLELRGNGVNSVAIGSSESGVMIRIDNVLNDLPNKLLKRETDLENLYEEEESINKELRKKPDYSENIEYLKYQIVKLERILGI